MSNKPSNKQLHNSTRRIEINLPFQSSLTNKFISNKIKTTKYTWFTFLPKTLYEQFRSIANFYFLFLALLQASGTFALISPAIAILPLAVIVLLTALKDAFEDGRRRSSDETVNNSTTYCAWSTY